MTKIKMNFLFPFFLLLLCLIFPSACMEGAKKGLSISLNLALPSLFPSLVLSGMITESFSRKSEEKRVFIPFFLGLFCGFPVGAKGVCDLYRKGKITKKEGEDLLFFSNNAGPSFLIGFVGNALFFDQRRGLFLFLFQGMISSICFLFFLRKKKKKTKEQREEENDAFSPSFFRIFSKSLSGGAFSFLYIMSCIIFFSFLTSLLCTLFRFPKKARALLSIFLELTGGCKNITTFSENLAFPLCAMGCGFGGLSVHLQTVGLLEETGLSAKKHFFGKLFFAVCMFFGALFFQKLL